MITSVLRRFAGLIVAFCLIVGVVACQRANERDFVGTWRSSRMETPLVLTDKGEWEIRGSAGRVLQYGVWRYDKGRVVWTFKQGGRVFDDETPLLRMGPNEFQVEEQDGSVTTFRRLN